ncbi:hypothetical protein [Mesorhizobium intechi]|uniref:hypothetical protein n=1 Tax=Mesorhizobium intechi TaxID=537601 RepID=UPI00142EF923|nr:hypothetical protein [Mesorhizobium intechi]
MAVNRLRCLSETKFATWVANGQSVCGNAQANGINCSRDRQNVQRHNKTPPWSEPGGVTVLKQQRQGGAAWKWSSDKTEARRSHRPGLAGHGFGKALALESGGQVHFAAGKEAGKKLHHHLLSVAQTGRLRLMEWGSSFAGGDIGLCWVKLNRKNEALDMKCDTDCDKFGQTARNL